jgi:hypothetical protein
VVVVEPDEDEVETADKYLLRIGLIIALVPDSFLLTTTLSPLTSTTYHLSLITHSGIRAPLYQVAPEFTVTRLPFLIEPELVVVVVTVDTGASHEA